MRIHKKQLLGLAGLALVAAMTAVACILPAAGANAADYNAGSVGLTVQVTDDGVVPLVNFEYPVDGDVVVRSTFTGKISYTHADAIQVFLRDVTTDSAEVEVPNNCQPSEGNAPQVCEISYDLSVLGTVNLTPEHQEEKYATRVVARRTEANLSAEDSVGFSYKAAHLVFSEEYDATGDPVVTALLNEKVQYAQIQVLSESGKPVFVSNDGVEEPLVIDINHDEFADGKYVLDLPFKQYGLPKGMYTAVLTAYEAEEPSDTSLIATSTAQDIPYPKGYKPGENPGPSGPGTNPTDPDDPNNPNGPGNGDTEVPDTGINLFRDLNISRADYVLTGVIVFGMVTAFALFLIRRRNRR